jgi:FkbM family methyltransferase
MSYTNNSFNSLIDSKKVKCILELGSRDLLDAFELVKHYQCPIYSFECNPDCLVECHKNLASALPSVRDKVNLVERAVSLDNGTIKFFPFDLKQYNNMGSSSLLKIDFSKRNKNDPDYNRPNPQKEIEVEGVRIDTFLETHDIASFDLVCIDLQGYELNALKSFGARLSQTKYIITECSIENTYTGGASFEDLYAFLQSMGFTYAWSDKYDFSFPNLNEKGFSEFNALFINKSI